MVMIVDDGCDKPVTIGGVRSLGFHFASPWFCTVDINEDTTLLVVGSRVVLTDGDGVVRKCIVSHTENGLAYISLDE